MGTTLWKKSIQWGRHSKLLEPNSLINRSLISVHGNLKFWEVFRVFLYQVQMSHLNYASCCISAHNMWQANWWFRAGNEEWGKCKKGPHLLHTNILWVYQDLEIQCRVGKGLGFWSCCSIAWVLRIHGNIARVVWSYWKVFCKWGKATNPTYIVATTYCIHYGVWCYQWWQNPKHTCIWVCIFYLHSYANKGGVHLHIPKCKWMIGSNSFINHLTLFLEWGATTLGSEVCSWCFPPTHFWFLMVKWKQSIFSKIDGGNLVGWNYILQWNYTCNHLVELINSNNILISNLTFQNFQSWITYSSCLLQMFTSITIF